MTATFYILAGLAGLMLALGFGIGWMSDVKRIKRNRNAIKPGRRVVCYACINKEFDDYRERYSYTVVECKKNYFKYKIGDTVGYDSFYLFGKYEDRVDVFDGDDLVLRTGYEDNLDF